MLGQLSVRQNDDAVHLNRLTTERGKLRLPDLATCRGLGRQPKLYMTIPSTPPDTALKLPLGRLDHFTSGPILCNGTFFPRVGNLLAQLVENTAQFIAEEQLAGLSESHCAQEILLLQQARVDVSNCLGRGTNETANSYFRNTGIPQGTKAGPDPSVFRRNSTGCGGSALRIFSSFCLAV